MFFAFNLKAQTANEKDLIICDYNVNADTTIHFFTVGFFNALFGKLGKQDVFFDFGKNIFTKDCNYDTKLIKDNNGELRRFYSTVEGLNYLYSRGWKLKAEWTNGSPQAPITYFLFERMEKLKTAIFIPLVPYLYLKI